METISVEKIETITLGKNDTLVATVGIPCNASKHAMESLIHGTKYKLKDAFPDNKVLVLPDYVELSVLDVASDELTG